MKDIRDVYHVAVVKRYYWHPEFVELEFVAVINELYVYNGQKTLHFRSLSFLSTPNLRL